MSDEVFFVRSMTLFPDGEAETAGALGLLLVDNAGGERLSVVADPEWVRTALAGKAAGADLTLLEVPEVVQLPIAATGWPEDWDPQDRAQILEMSERLKAAASWASLCQDLDALIDDAGHPSAKDSPEGSRAEPEDPARETARRFSQELGIALDDEVEGWLIYRSDDSPYDDPGVTLSAVALAVGDLIDECMDDWWDRVQPIIEDEKIDALLQALTPFVPSGGLGWGSVSVEGGAHIASDGSAEE